MGSGFRTFAYQEVLTSSNVQNYLMDQAVTVFAGTAARGSAITSPETGMVSYRTDGTADSKREGFEFYDGSGWVRMIPAASTSAVATVNTEQSTTSTSYTDLATSGPSVTLTTGTKALVFITASSYNNTADRQNYVSFAVSGASTVAVSDDWALLHKGVTSITEVSATRVQLVTGLTAGSNTFTLKYKVSGGTGYFQRRQIAVIDLGS